MMHIIIFYSLGMVAQKREQKRTKRKTS